MPPGALVLDLVSIVAAGVYGFWVLFPLAALRNVMDVRGGWRSQVRKVPRNMLLFWSTFAGCRLVMFIRPMPILLPIVPEPIGTYLFFAAGAICFLLWWRVDLHGHLARPQIQARAPAVGTFTIPRSGPTAAPVCPKCGVPMVERTAKRGKYQGQTFYGCPNFPRCREARSL